MPELPDKEFYRLNEVCQHTDTQPYVLRFWESEFPQLSPGKSPGGQRIYSRDDVQLVLRIKQLLYDEQFTIAGARTRLEEENGSPRRKKRSRSAARHEPVRQRVANTPHEQAQHEAGGGTVAAGAEALDALDVVPRDRYEAAVDEIERLRFQLKETTKGLQKAEAGSDRLRREIAAIEARAERAAVRIRSLVEALER